MTKRVVWVLLGAIMSAACATSVDTDETKEPELEIAGDAGEPGEPAPAIAGSGGTSSGGAKSTATGGRVATSGGGGSSGGAAAPAGAAGRAGSGGAATATGGAPSSTGGKGGAAGSMSTGGMVSTGGSVATGGQASMGGAVSTGGRASAGAAGTPEPEAEVRQCTWAKQLPHIMPAEACGGLNFCGPDLTSDKCPGGTATSEPSSLDCNRNGLDGCEVPVSDTNCGECGKVCAGNTRCRHGFDPYGWDCYRI